MQKGNVVAQALQITDDMRRNQDGVCFILHKIIEDIENFVADNRIESAGRLIENQHRAVLDHGPGDGE